MSAWREQGSIVTSRLKDWIVDRIPAPLMRRYWWYVRAIRGYVAMKRGSIDVPPPMSVPNGAARLYIGPANYAGQGRMWAASVQRWLPEVSAVNMTFVSGREYLFYSSDYLIPEPIYLASHTWKSSHRETMLKFTHVLIEALQSNAHEVTATGAAHEAEFLAENGVSVAWMCHGKEVRLPSRHRALEPWSPFIGVRSRRAEDQVMQNLEILSRRNDPVFVSTPDLLVDVPWAKWCPVVVDCDQWKTERLPFAGSKLRVAHSPTHRGTKGTDLILPTLRGLEGEGLIELDLVEGVPNAEMPDRLALADVVLDQFLIGSYGVCACEAMAAGRLVIGHVSDRVREIIERQSGYALPVVEATVDSLEVVLREIAADRDRAVAVASLGPVFVRAVHDGRLSVATLTPWLLRV